jgi:antitoxin CptB
VDTERKRLAMRAWRRGTREADLMLGPWADAMLPGMDAAALSAFADLLEENDVDLAAWLMGLRPPPDRFAPQIAAIAGFATERAAAARAVRQTFT